MEPRITQKELGNIYNKIINNPESYTGIPLLIWRSYYYDGIQFNILHDFSSAHNRDRNDKEREYFKVRRLRWDIDNFTDLANSLDPERCKGIIFFMDPETPEFQNSEHPDNDSWQKLSSVIGKLKDVFKIPVIFLLPMMEHPEAFETMETIQYVFQPDYEEWKQRENRTDQPLYRLLTEFIEKAQTTRERDYRWYWYFHRISSSNPEDSGCDFPSCWTDGVYQLHRYIYPPMAQIPKNYKPRKVVKISEIKEETFLSFFDKGISTDLILAFRSYLISHHNSWEDIHHFPPQP